MNYPEPVLIERCASMEVNPIKPDMFYIYLFTSADVTTRECLWKGTVKVDEMEQLIEDMATVMSGESLPVDPSPPYIDVYQPIAGWKAIMYVWSCDLNGYEPGQTGFCAYATREEAVADAIAWGKAEEVDCQAS
jgi:hypothetical protein